MNFGSEGTCRLGLNLGYSGSAIGIDLTPVEEADRLGYHSVWSAEAYGSDAVSTIAWVAARTSRIGVGTAIMQIPARSPALTATTALTLDQLSSGPLPASASACRARRSSRAGTACRSASRSGARASTSRSSARSGAARSRSSSRATHYEIPYAGPGATGLGKPLKSILHASREIPIYLAAIGPKNVALAAEIADGWLPIFFSPERMSIWKESLDAGFRAAGGGKSLARFDVAPTVPIVLGPDAAQCRAMVKPRLALYVGGMGARDKNFYNELVCRYGYEEAAAKIQSLYLSGKREEAAAAVPDALVDEVALCGPRERIKERLSRWTGSGVTTMICAVGQVEAVRTMAELVL